MKIGLKGRRGENPKNIIAALTSKWDLTPREIEAIEDALGDEDENEVGIEESLGDDDEPSIDDEEPSIDDEEPSIDDEVPISAKNKGIIDRAKAKDTTEEREGGTQAEIAGQKYKKRKKEEAAAKAAKKKGGDSNVGKKKGKPAKQEKPEERKPVVKDPGADNLVSSSDAVDSAWDYLSLLKGR